jgi:hypothetical protein
VDDQRPTGTFALALELVAPIQATLYKDPQCDCCEGYAAYLRKKGFAVDVKPTNDLAEISRRAGVPSEMQGKRNSLLNRTGNSCEGTGNLYARTGNLNRV